MALNGSTRRSPDPWHDNRPTHDSFGIWLNKSGKDAFKNFQKDHPTNKISYDSWSRGEQVYGPYLFYVTSMIWHEDDDSDEESTKRRRISRVPDENPKRTATTNGNGPLPSAGSATPAPAANSDEINVSGKRKRKPRKKYMSQELVASDEELADEVEAAPVAGNETPARPATAVNGLRKPTTRKPRKKPISDETISLEDENDDPMDIEAHPVASSLPVRSVPRAAAPARQSESPKKATPKHASVKKSRKSFLSEEMVLDEDSDNGEASIAEVSRPAKSKPDIETDTNAEEDAELKDEGTPDPSAANTRRGLRNRKPAQQRPYYFDAQVFEDVETEQDDDSELDPGSREVSLEAPPPSKPKHFKGKGRAWKKDGSDEDEEFVTPKEKKATKSAKAKIDRERIREDREQDITRALWDALIGSDVDSDERQRMYDDTIKRQEQNKQKLAAAEDTPKETPKPKKKIGRPRKNPAENTPRDGAVNGTPQTPTQPPKRGRGRPRKSALSSEIVRDESEDETPAPAKAPSPSARNLASPKQPTTTNITPPKQKPTSRPSTATSTTHSATPRKRGRPRKSSSIAATATPIAPNNPIKETPSPAKDTASTAKDTASTAKDTISTTKDTISTTKDTISTAKDTASTTAQDTPGPEPTNPVPANDANDFPVPSLNRGAALIESLYPRDIALAGSVSTPMMVASPALGGVPAEAETPAGVVREGDGDSEVEKAVGESGSADTAGVGEGVEGTKAVSEAQGEDEGEMSAAMSLSSDSE